jgi:hypothetical protein
MQKHLDQLLRADMLPSTSPFSGAPLAARPLQGFVGRRRTFFPLRNVATHYPKQGVRLWIFDC